jgi:hypothetical protein
MNGAVLSTILMVFAFVLFAIAAIWNPAPPDPLRTRLIAAGLACWALAIILVGFHL